MWKMSKRLAVCVFAAAWWGIFYPELCFSEETCVKVQTESAQEEMQETQSLAEGIKKRWKERGSDVEEIDKTAAWWASGDEIVIRSRLWEWCEENLFDS